MNERGDREISRNMDYVMMSFNGNVADGKTKGSKTNRNCLMKPTIL